MRFLQLAMILLFSLPSLADDSAAHQNLERSLRQANSVSYLDIAGSHSFLEAKFGLGIDNAESYAAEAEQQEKAWLWRSWLYLGLPYPFSGALSAVLPKDTEGVQQYSGFVQWTLYERLARPAIALRYSLNHAKQQGDGSLNTMAGGLALSYGIGMFSVIAATELRQDRFQTGANFEDPYSKVSSFYTVADFGVHMQVIPAKLTLAFVAKSARDGLNYSANFQFRI